MSETNGENDWLELLRGVSRAADSMGHLVPTSTWFGS